PAAAKRIAIVDRTTACPTGFKQTDVLEVKPGDVCGCSCGMTVPTCPGAGEVKTFYSNMSTTCGTTGVSFYPTGAGTCTNFTGGVGLGNYFKATPLNPPTGGFCSAMPTVADKASMSNPRRL